MLDLATKKGLFTFGLSSFNKISSLIKNLDYLPQKPSYMLKLLKMVYATDVSNDQVVVEITKDKELITKLMEIPAIKNQGLTLNQEDISKVIAKLEKNFLEATLEVDFAKKFHKGLSIKTDLAKLDKWKKSLKAATIAKAIARWTGYEHQELAFMSALLMDMPQMILDISEPEQKAKLEEKIAQGMSMKEAELVVYGFDHGKFGVRLFKHLGLPTEMQELVAVESNPELIKPKYLKLAQIVSFARFIAGCFCDKTQSPSSIWNESQKSIQDLDLKITLEQWGNKISLLFVKSVEFEMSVMG